MTSDSCFGEDDYSKIDGLLQELEARISQISKILDAHSNPNMYGSDDCLQIDPLTGENYFPGGTFIPVPLGGVTPQYLTWDGKLDSAWAEIEFLLQQLYILSETSAALFGKVDSGAINSGSALKDYLLHHTRK